MPKFMYLTDSLPLRNDTTVRESAKKWRRTVAFPLAFCYCERKNFLRRKDFAFASLAFQQPFMGVMPNKAYALLNQLALLQRRFSTLGEKPYAAVSIRRVLTVLQYGESTRDRS